jgi:hypothetical protein
VSPDSIFNAAPGPDELEELTDVNLTNPVEFDTLEYNGTEWVNKHSSLVSWVRNAEATTLNVGEVVYLFGATGDHATVKRADNDSDATSSKTVGLVATSIASGANGTVVTRGYVDGINLSVGYTAGDILWLGENGGFTKTKPTSPEHLVFVGVVVRATNNGIVYVATQNGYELDELHDVSIDEGALADGQVLTYNSTSGLWENEAAAANGPTLYSTEQNFSSGSAETFDRITAAGGAARTHTSGVLYLTALTPNEPVTADQITVFGVATGSSLTLVKLALFTFDGTTYTRVAVTADVKAQFNVNTSLIPCNFTGSYALSADTTYYVGILQIGTTPETLLGPATPTSAAGYASFLNAKSPKLCRSIAGQTDISSTYLESAMSDSTITAWARLD